MMRFKPEERPIAIQIFATMSPHALGAEIAQEAGADFVDIKLRLPARKVVHGGGGSNRLRDLPNSKRF
ncbi:MAG: hypothetical protein IPO77_21365 [Acidobacteria bacterium]|nr:hypothetical protein [Acidobacteriota bacterium]